jgi:hypothetical protein
MMRARLAAIRAAYARSDYSTRIGIILLVLTFIWFGGRSLA